MHPISLGFQEAAERRINTLIAIGGAVLLFSGSCIAGTAEELAEEYVRNASGALPVPFGRAVTLVNLRSRGSRIILDLKTTAARKNLSNTDFEALMRVNRDNQCTDPSTRNVVAQGVSFEMRFIWRDGATSSIDINSKVCGVIKGEVNAESEAGIRDMINLLSPNLPVKIDENITLASVSQVGKMGLKYSYIFDTHNQNISASQLETVRLSVKDEVCQNSPLVMLMRGGVKLIFSYQTTTKKPLTETTVTIASCKG